MSDIPPPAEGNEPGPPPVAWDPSAAPPPEPGSVFDLPYAAADDPLDVSEPSRWAKAPKLPRLGRGSKGTPAPSHAAPSPHAEADAEPTGAVLKDLPTLPGMSDAPQLPGWADPPRLPPASDLPATTWEPTFQPSERSIAPPSPAPPPPAAEKADIDWQSSWSPAPPPPPGAAPGPPPPPGAPAGPAGPSMPVQWAVGIPAPPGEPAPARPLPTLRIAEGVLVGLAAAAVAGLAWWGVAALTQRQFVYLAILIGFGVGRGAVVGARRGSPGLAVFAFVITLAALACAEYFIQRSLAIESLHAEIPLWSGFDFAKEVVKSSIKDSPLNLVFWLVAAGIAGFQAARPSARPIL